MTFQLLHCRPDPLALAAWATRQRLLSPDGDYGYALHALLTAAFGEKAPKPFRYMGERQGLLAYTDRRAETLRENAALATPEVARALGLDSLATRQFPTTWHVGQRLAFEVRVRPVVRTKDGRERDVFLHAAESTEPRRVPQREEVYAEWLGQQLSTTGAAKLVHSGLDAFRLTRVVRRVPVTGTGKRRAQTITGPDALFKGELTVTDSEAFARLMARGVGRHRAFGFGMLLLKPC
jgi:CRISPR system Cascade subunit CasE